MMYLDDSLTSEELADTRTEQRATARESRFVMITWHSASGHTWKTRAYRTDTRWFARDVHAAGGAILAITTDGN